MLRPIRLLAHVAGTYLLWCFQFAGAAHGDPVSVAILTAMGYSGAAGLLAPTAVLASLAWNAVVAAIPTFLLNAAIALGATLIANALRPQPQSNQVNPGSRLVNLRQTIQDRTKSYGLVRLGGPVAFWKAKGGKRYVAVLLNTGEITSVEGHYLDETEVTLDGSGYVTQSKFKSDDNSMVRIGSFRGNSGQTVPYLNSAFTEWTSAHNLEGIAGSVVVFQNPDIEDFNKVYPSGREHTYTALIKGTKVYDPRDNTQTLGDATTYKYTTNAALIIADWLTSVEDGLGAEVDWDDVSIEADVCDVVVEDRDGNELPKWQLCGTYSLNQARETVRQQLAIGCDAFFFDRDDGKVGFHVGRWIEPQVTITDEHILSIRVSEGQDGTERTNAISVHYTEPGAGYREFQTAPYIISDGEPYHEETFTAYWIPNHNQGVRVGKRVLLASRGQYSVQMSLKLYGLLLRDQRFFRLELSELGISGPFELASWSFGEDGRTITVTARSVAQTDFDFDAATEEPAPATITDFTVTDDIGEPTNVTLSSPAEGAIHVTFDAPSRPSLLQRLRYREVGSTNWNEVGVPSNQTYYTVNGLPVGDIYEAEVQFRTATATASDWVDSVPASVTVAATSTPPDPVTGASATGGVGEATFDWTAPNSPNYVGARIYTNTVDDFGTATLQDTEYGLPNNADSAVVTGLSAGTLYGWVVAINSDGDEATATATGSFTVT